LRVLEADLRRARIAGRRVDPAHARNRR
jgi:hypothetical protein